MNCDKVNFTSRIVFVPSRQAFDKIACGYNIPFGIVVKYNKKASKFYTKCVRTCTAGALINTKTKEAIGFHIYDCLQNYKNIKKIIKSMIDQINPDKCLLFGGKKYSGNDYSMPIFRKTARILRKNIKNMTVFKRHMYACSETNMYYSLNEDTFYILSRYVNKKGNVQSVSSENDLREIFKKISVSPDDELIFA